MKTIKCILTFLLLFTIASCSSKQDITAEYIKDNPLYLAEQCAINFPSKIKYVEGETKTDTIIKTLPGVEIPCPETTDENGNKYIPKVNCPDQEVIETITTKTDTIYLENTANVIRLKQENVQLAEKIKELENANKDLKSAKNRLYWIIGTLILGVVVIWKIK